MAGVEEDGWQVWDADQAAGNTVMWRIKRVEIWEGDGNRNMS